MTIDEAHLANGIYLDLSKCEEAQGQYEDFCGLLEQNSDGYQQLTTTSWLENVLVIFDYTAQLDYPLFESNRPVEPLTTPDSTNTTSAVSTCHSVPPGIAEIESPWRTNDVSFDGKITDAEEWVDASCFDLPLLKDKSGPTQINSRWWFKNDAKWLYLLARVPVTEVEASGVYMGYYWPSRRDGQWEHSDVGWVGQDGNTYDGHGWDESQFYDDTEASSPGQNNVEGAVSKNSAYYWFEFRKALDSSDGHDWAWEPGEMVGTGQTGNLLLGIRGEETIYEVLIRLQLDSQ